MTSAATAAERVRLFVALELPRFVRGAIVRWRSEALREVGGLRLIMPEDLHVTLCFLGWRSAADVGSVISCVQRCAGSPPAELVLAGALWLPPRCARVLALELQDTCGRLSELQSTICSVLSAEGWYEPEGRPFLAHVTLARVARGTRAPRGALGPPPALKFQASLVTVYQSRLHSSGARYEPLRSVELGISR